MDDDKKKPLGVDWEHEHRRLLLEKVYGVYKVEDDLPKQKEPEPTSPKIRRSRSIRKKVVVRKQAAPELTEKYLEIARHLAYQKLTGKCNYCHEREGLTYDHIYPTSKGGCKCKANVQVLCRYCNGRKGDAILKDANGRPFGHTQEECPFKKEDES